MEGGSYNSVGFSLAIDEGLINRMTKADKLIKDIGTHSEQTRDKLVTAFRGMGDNGVGYLISKLQEVQNKMSAINGGKISIDTNTIDQSISKTNTNIDKLAEGFKNLEVYLKSLSKRERINLISDTKDYSGALNYSKSTKSIEEQIKAIKYLDKARKSLSREGLSEGEYYSRIQALTNEINRQKKSVNELTGAYASLGRNKRSLLNLSEQLMRRLALVFSVSQVTGYINKLIEVRGEFELQQRSLEAIIQNKDEANKLWNQTVQLAITSPFRIKELVTYTKQLAAYRIETDKLYKTNKMLADISAGLGVDMRRLILAFGQVKAANYLRGTELRQFSEAGVNILGELATYFSEIEDRAVSVGEVFNMVSKRMVSFADVEKVLQRLTSEGNPFFRMQEIQSETIKGMWSNLMDSLDIMMNNIGKSSEGVIKYLLNLFKSLIDNWKVFADILKGSLALFAIYKINAWGLNKALVDFAKQMKLVGSVNLLQVALAKVSKGFKAATAAAKSFIASNWLVLAFVGVIGAIREIVLWNSKYNDKIEELNRKREEEISSLNKLAQEYKVLTQSEKDEADISDDLFNKKLSKLKEFQKSVGLTSLEIPMEFGEVTKENIDKIFAQTEEMATYAQDFGFELGKNIAKGLTGKQGGLLWVHWLGDNLKTDFADLENKLAEISGAAQNRLQVLMNEIGSSYNNLSDNAKGYYKALKEGKNETETTYDWYKRQVTMLNMIAKEFKFRNNDILKDANSLLNNIKRNEEEVFYELDKVVRRQLKDYGVKDFADLPKEQQMMIKIQIDKAFERLELSASAQRIAAFFTAQSFKIPYTLTPAKSEDKGLPDWAKRYNEYIKTLNSNAVKEVTNVETTIDSLLSNLNTHIKEEENIVNRAKAGSKAYTAEEIVNAQKRLDAYKAARAWLQGDDVNKTNKTNKQENILNKRISLIKEMHKTYLELAKTFDSVTAKEKVMASYRDTFEEAFLGTGVSFSKIVKQISSSLDETSNATGNILTDEVKTKIKELKDAGTYIRTYSESAVEDIKKWEGFRAEPYKHKNDVWTIGYGETKGVTADSLPITKEEAEARLRLRLTRDFASELNKVLDLNKDIILTQEQYNVLLSLTYQGGIGKVKDLIEQSRDVEEGVKVIQTAYQMVNEYIGEDAAQRFGDAFVQKFRDAETIYERMALLLQAKNLYVREGGSGKTIIDKTMYAGMQKRSDSRSSIFSGDLDIANSIENVLVRISSMDFTSIEGMVDILDSLMPLATKEGRESIIQLKKEISSMEAQIGVNIKQGSDKELVNRIQDMINSYKFYLEIDKLNIPQSLAKDLFNIETTSLETIKGYLSSQQEQFVGEDMVKEYDKLWKTILDMENNAQMERLKNYSKYLTNATSQFVQLKLKAFDEISEIKKTFTLSQPIAEREFGVNSLQWGMLNDIMKETQKSFSELSDEEYRSVGISDKYISKIREYLLLMDEQSRKAIAGVKRDSNAKLQQQQWEDFKSSDMYVLMFEDIENIGTKSLEALKKRLNDLKSSLSNLPANQVKEIVKQINSIDDQLISRNPLSETIRLAKEIKNYPSLEDLQIQLINAEKEKEEAQNIINIIDEVTSAEEKGNIQLVDETTIGQYNKIVALAEQEGKDVNNVRKDKEKIVRDQEKIISYATEGITIYAQHNKALQKQSDWWGAINDKINGVFDNLKGLMGILGEDADSTNMAIIDITQNMFSLVAATLQMSLAMKAAGVAANSALGVIGWIAIVLQSVVSLFSSLFGAKDKALQKQIEDLQENVKALEWSLNNLNKAFDDVFNISDMERYTREMRTNLNAQIKSYQMMIKAERDKKSTDEAQIREWQRTIGDLQQQLLDVEKDAFNKATADILDNTLSAAAEFTDAWLNAFKETGSGLSGLEENFKEATLNMVKQQASLFITGTYVDRWKKNLEQYINASDLELTTQEANAWMKSVQTELPLLNDALEKYFNAMKQAGVDIYNTSSDLSGLQRGIQGITETQADEIAAYLNTLRFLVSNSLDLLTSFYNIFSNDTMANPMLAELRTQTGLIRTIKDMLGSVIGRGNSTHNGAYLKVAL